MPESMQSRLMRKVEVAESGCWEWNGAIQANGYGRVRESGKTMYAHRAAYVAFIGPIASGKDVCHTCDNRLCINPNHLFLGSRKDNMRDAMRKGRLSSGASHAKLLSGDKGPGAKLTMSQVVAIRKCAEKGARASDLASIANVSADNIRLVIKGKTWKEDFLCAE